MEIIILGQYVIRDEIMKCKNPVGSNIGMEG